MKSTILSRFACLPAACLPAACLIASTIFSSACVGQVVSDARRENSSSKQVAVLTPVVASSVSPGMRSLAPRTSIRQMRTDDDLMKMIKESPGVVLIDFYADWCPPCRAQGVILHELDATAQRHKASVIKINIDQHRKLAELFKIKKLPTMLLVKNKRIVDRQIGIASHARVTELLSK